MYNVMICESSQFVEVCIGVILAAIINTMGYKSVFASKILESKGGKQCYDQ